MVQRGQQSIDDVDIHGLEVVRTSMAIEQFCARLDRQIHFVWGSGAGAGAGTGVVLERVQCEPVHLSHCQLVIQQQEGEGRGQEN